MSSLSFKSQLFSPEDCVEKGDSILVCTVSLATFGRLYVKHKLNSEPNSQQRKQAETQLVEQHRSQSQPLSPGWAHLSSSAASSTAYRHLGLNNYSME